MIGHGVDIVCCDRVARIWSDHGNRFLERVYTEAERSYCLRGKTQVVRLAGRFAAKEAILKALGTGWRGGIEWTDLEVLPDPLGRPHVQLSGAAALLAQRLGVAAILISISHTDEHAIASAIAQSEARP